MIPPLDPKMAEACRLSMERGDTLTTAEYLTELQQTRSSMRTTRDARTNITALKQSLAHLEQAVERVAELKTRITANNKTIQVVGTAVGFTVKPTPAYSTRKVEEFEFGPDHRISNTIIEFLKAENSQLEVLLYDAINTLEERSAAAKDGELLGK